MSKLLLSLLAFGLLLQWLGEVRLSVLLAGIMLAAGIIAFTHFLLNYTANSP